MTSSRIIEELLLRPRQEIADELDSVRQSRARLDLEEQFLTQALALRDLAKGSGSVERDAQADTRHEHEGQLRDLTVIDAVQVAVREAAGRWVTPAEIDTWLGQNGVVTTRNNIRVALRRLQQRGRIDRDGDKNRYRVPADLTLDAPDGAQS